MAKKPAKRKAKKPAVPPLARMLHRTKAPRCETAKGDRCRCGFCEGDLHNPPRKIKVQRLGEVVSIKYRHSKDGKLYEHKFAGRARVYIVAGGRELIVSPVSIVRVERRHFIGD